MRKGGVPVTKNMYTVAGDSPCNEELALRIQAGDKNAAERLISQNEGYLTGLARAYTHCWTRRGTLTPPMEQNC